MTDNNDRDHTIPTIHQASYILAEDLPGFELVKDAIDLGNNETGEQMATSLMGKATLFESFDDVGFTAPQDMIEVLDNLPEGVLLALKFYR